MHPTPFRHVGSLDCVLPLAARRRAAAPPRGGDGAGAARRPLFFPAALQVRRMTS